MIPPQHYFCRSWRGCALVQQHILRSELKQQTASCPDLNFKYIINRVKPSITYFCELDNYIYILITYIVKCQIQTICQRGSLHFLILSWVNQNSELWVSDLLGSFILRRTLDICIYLHYLQYYFSMFIQNLSKSLTLQQDKKSASIYIVYVNIYRRICAYSRTCFK